LRIPLNVEKFYSDRKVVFANFFVQIPSMRVAHTLSAVVDSGSPFTTISTRDALAFSLPIKNWKVGELTHLAGFKFYGHYLEATLNFRDEQKNIARFRCRVRVLVPTKIDEKTIREVQDIPSLIGTDFLEDNRFTFVYNPSSETAYLEKAETEQPPSTNQAGTTEGTNR